MMTEALKRAQRKYYEQKRSKMQKTISITLSTEQAEADKETLAQYGLTPLKFWRQSIEQLKAAPPQDTTE